MMSSILPITGEGMIRPTLSFALMIILASQGVAGTRDQPNVILIVADDLGYGDLGCYGQTLIRTPNLDHLATEGLRFTQAYAGSTVCTPSRCVLMTGRHTGHAAARDNIPHYDSYLEDGDVTVAEVLQGAGYRCGGVGKWSLGDAGTIGRATNQGFETWFGYLNQDHAHYYFTDYLDDDEGRLELHGNSASREFYSHDLLTERALKFVEEAEGRAVLSVCRFDPPPFLLERRRSARPGRPRDGPVCGSRLG